MDKDGRAEAPKHHIGLPGQIGAVQPVPKAVPIKCLPNEQLRLGVLAFYGAHVTGALLRRHSVRHYSPLSTIGSHMTSNRNPPWSQDELILALDLYLSIKPVTPGPTLPEVIALSRELRSIAPRSGIRPSRNFRSAASVVMKLMNFRSLDDDYPGAGLSAGGQGDLKVWNELSGDPKRLRLLARAVLETYQDTTPFPPAAEEDEGAAEGGILYRLHLQHERSPALAAKRKQQALKMFGCLCCEVCGFDFQKTYGVRGHGYIECHHIKPLYALRPGSKTRLEDLALVCANCHRMLHRTPWPTTAELKGYLAGSVPSQA
jgi:5-methylcytosine-specific restriction protein A